MIIVLSGSYVGEEMQAEFGKLPPSFLPLGNKRLFWHQFNLFPAEEKRYLSLPISYELSPIDKELLSELNVKILRTPDEFTLGEGLISCFSLIHTRINEPLKILFGDTLVLNPPSEENQIGVSTSDSNYRVSGIRDNKIEWRETADQDDTIVCGYFSFDKPHLLARCIALARWDFIRGLDLYHAQNALTYTNLIDWFDFGHVNSYYQSKAKFTTQRAFNELKIDLMKVRKSSKDRTKMEAEANWFESIPKELKAYTPQFLGSHTSDKSSGYSLEYLYNTALNELYVFGNLEVKAWKTIIDHCLSFIESCFNHPDTNEEGSKLSELLTDKTYQRLNHFCSDKGLKLSQTWDFNGENYTLQSLLDACAGIPDNSSAGFLMHGDFCFSNILYDFKTNRIKTIDPRGLSLQRTITIYGDPRYDIAKLAHSILGMYDWIIAGYHSTNINWNKQIIEFKIFKFKRQLKIERYFLHEVRRKFDLSEKDVYTMQLNLFLAMLPLHSEDQRRVDGLFATCFTLYKKIKSL